MLGPREIAEADVPNASFVNTVAELHARLRRHRGLGERGRRRGQAAGPGRAAADDPGDPGLATRPLVRQLDRPPIRRIYCGLDTTQSVVSGTTQPEFNYPSGSGDNHVHANRSEVGIPITNPIDKLALSLAGLRRLQPLPQQLADREQPRARATARSRPASPRWRRSSPSTGTRTSSSTRSTGHLMWIADAYVKTSLFPEAYQQSDGTSYMRNAVKAVIDAKTCAITLYAVEPERADHGGVERDLPRTAHAAQRDLDVPALASALPGRPVQRPGAGVRAGAHHQRVGLLQRQRPVQHRPGEPQRDQPGHHRVLRRGDASRHEQPAVRAPADIFSGSERGRRHGEQHDGVARRGVRLHEHQRPASSSPCVSTTRTTCSVRCSSTTTSTPTRDQLGDQPARASTGRRSPSAT